MTLLLMLLAVVVVGLLTGLLVRTTGTGQRTLGDETMAEPTSSSPFVPLPERTLRDDDVAALRFDQVFRGYRMSQVDAVLDRLRAELADRDAQIEQLSEDVRDFEVRYGARVSAPTMPGLWSRQPQAGTTTESEPSP
ncbi:DivIVA domain-containing protein [Arsenicicoccus piscis]|uniref:DivIVA domain-containing protein n=1 Tax=Arsenicicoccus piscis TaxID=673954 RepID=A0ABQ6HIS0_9MICO|nr:DivIVA domain-containing protein [Arsenicicoccus piscis]MCH8628202.1 DivIVA domain-containing protein [Arsenicicoccus piscis]GMA18444.1 hypothetical protein GCM10025862_04650 [Arsenicicoccus piscis]